MPAQQVLSDASMHPEELNGMIRQTANARLFWKSQFEIRDIRF